jgi:hypothetical protein
MANPVVYAEWWGANAGDGNNDYAAIQAALNAITVGPGATSILQLLGGEYDVGTTLVIKRGCLIQGVGMGNRAYNEASMGTMLSCTANTSLLHVVGTGTLHAVENQICKISNLGLKSEVTATAGSYGIKVDPDNSVMLELNSISISGFYNGLYINGMRVWAYNMRLNNQVDDGVYYAAGDWATFHLVSVIAAGGNGFYLQGLAPRLIDCETYGSKEWGVYAHEVDIRGGYYNQDWAGEVYVYHASSYGRGASITDAILEYAGNIPTGWHGLSPNPSAVALKVSLYDDATAAVLVSNTEISNSQGTGVELSVGRLNISNSSIQYSGIYGTNLYEIKQTGGISTLTGNSFGPGGRGIYISGGYSAISGNAIQTSTSCIDITGATNVEITGNMLYSHYNNAAATGINIASSAIGYVTYVNNDFQGFLNGIGTPVKENSIEVSRNKFIYETTIAADSAIGDDFQIVGAGTDIGMQINNTGSGGKNWTFLSSNTGGSEAGALTIYDVTDSKVLARFRSSGYEFEVNGDIKTNATICADSTIRAVGGFLGPGGSCDYVFEPGYKLMDLDDLSRFVKEHKHLPEMTINKGGEYFVHEGIEELIVKTEEQALYILQLHDRLSKLENLVTKLTSTAASN